MDSMDTMKIGLLLQSIALSVDDENLKKISSDLNEIEEIVLKYAGKGN